ERDGVAVAVQLVDPGRVGQRLLKGHDPVRAGHAAEERDGGRGSPVASRLYVDQVQDEGVAGLGALDVERPGLRVHEPEVDLGAGQVADAAQHAAEGVVGPEPQRGPGGDAHGWRDTAERVRVLIAGRRVLDDVHDGNLLRRAQPYPVAAEVVHARDAQQ